MTTTERQPAEPLDGAVRRFEDGFCRFLLKNHRASNAQLGQDLLALYALPEGRVFLDVGAADPMLLSNTRLLEDRGWTGLLVEPIPAVQERIAASRSSVLVRAAVTPEPQGPQLFHIVTDLPELSALATRSVADSHETAGRRNAFTAIQVETIGIAALAADCLARFGRLDFVSIDVEGLELPLMQRFPFDVVTPDIFVIEHNFTEALPALDALMATQDYVRVAPQLSRWDAWYVRRAVLGRTVQPTLALPTSPVSVHDWVVVNRLEIIRFANERGISGTYDVLSALLARSPLDYRLAARTGRQALAEDHMQDAADLGLLASRTALQAGDRAFAAAHVTPLIRIARRALGQSASPLPNLQWITPGPMPPVHGVHHVRMADGLLFLANRLPVVRRDADVAFGGLMMKVPLQARMVACGGAWPYYASWFLSERPANGECAIAEWDPVALALGIETLRINGVEANVHFGAPRAESESARTTLADGTVVEVPRFELAEFLERKGWNAVDVLFLGPAKSHDWLISVFSDAITKYKIRNLVISYNNSDEKMFISTFFAELGYQIMAAGETEGLRRMDGLTGEDPPDSASILVGRLA